MGKWGSLSLTDRLLGRASPIVIVPTVGLFGKAPSASAHG